MSLMRVRCIVCGAGGEEEFQAFEVFIDHTTGEQYTPTPSGGPSYYLPDGALAVSCEHHTADENRTAYVLMERLLQRVT